MENVTDSLVQQMAWQRWGMNLKKTAHAEWHGGCPSCGGTKRFWIGNKGHFQCRECELSGWLDDNLQIEKDPAKIAAWKAEQDRLEGARQLDIARRLTELRTYAEQSAYRLGRDDEADFLAKQYFNSEGISDRLIEKYELGYTREHLVKTDEGILHLPAYTIPIYHPITRELVNYQYRLADPPPGVGKYKQSYGVPAASFFADPMPDGIQGDAVICEGAKKAIVTHDHLDGAVQVVGLPGCAPSKLLLEQLKSFTRVWLALDPGCDSQARRIKSLLPQVKILSLPAKIDDLFRSGMTREQFREFCYQGR